MPRTIVPHSAKDVELSKKGPNKTRILVSEDVRGQWRVWTSTYKGAVQQDTMGGTCSTKLKYKLPCHDKKDGAHSRTETQARSVCGGVLGVWSNGNPAQWSLGGTTLTAIEVRGYIVRLLTTTARMPEFRLLHPVTDSVRGYLLHGQFSEAFTPRMPKILCVSHIRCQTCLNRAGYTRLSDR